jgi:hypothetical protein
MLAESMGLPFVCSSRAQKNMADKIKWRVFYKENVVVVED